MITRNEFEALDRLFDMVISNVVKDEKARGLVKGTIDILLVGLYNIIIEGDDECTDDDPSAA